ncbi:MAG: hypothetical protein LBL66_00435 [Clostridiales bacterium]|jgi:hypothetical protein|nr:hypothetical protein [Clostridiales bacterium]
MKRFKLALICLLCACVAVAAFACGTNPKNTDPTKPLTAEKAAEVVGGYKSPLEFDSYAMNSSLQLFTFPTGASLNLSASLSQKYQKTADGFKAYAKVGVDDGTRDFLQTAPAAAGGEGVWFTALSDGAEAWIEAAETAGTLYLKSGDNKVYGDLPAEALAVVPMLTDGLNVFDTLVLTLVQTGADVSHFFNEDGMPNYDAIGAEAGMTAEQTAELKELADRAPIKADGGYDLEKLLKNFADYTVAYDKKEKKNTINFTISKAKVKAFALDVAKFAYEAEGGEFDAEARAEIEPQMDAALAALDCFSFEIVPGKDYFESVKVTVNKIGDFLATLLQGSADMFAAARESEGAKAAGVSYAPPLDGSPESEGNGSGGEENENADPPEPGSSGSGSPEPGAPGTGSIFDNPEFAAAMAMFGDPIITLSVNFKIGGQTVDIPSVTDWTKGDFFTKQVPPSNGGGGSVDRLRSEDEIFIEVEDDENAAEVLAAAILDKANETYGEDFTVNARIELFGYLVYSDELQELLDDVIQEGELVPYGWYEIEFNTKNATFLLHFIWVLVEAPEQVHNINGG